MSNTLTIIGTIKHIGQRQQITEKFAKRQFVLDVKNGNYTDMVALQFVNDRTDLIDPYQIGQEVRVHFNPRSREYNGQYYTELTAWGIAKNTPDVTQYATDPASANMTQNKTARPAPNTPDYDPDDELPF